MVQCDLEVIGWFEGAPEHKEVDKCTHELVVNDEQLEVFIEFLRRRAVASEIATVKKRQKEDLKLSCERIIDQELDMVTASGRS